MLAKSPVLERRETVGVNAVDSVKGGVEHVKPDMFHRFKMDVAILGSIWYVNSIIDADGVQKKCLMISAETHKDGGFIAISRTLRVLEHNDLAARLNRASFIEDVCRVYEDPSFNSLINVMIAEDGCSDLPNWRAAFGLEERFVKHAHLALISRLYNLSIELSDCDDCLPENEYGVATKRVIRKFDCGEGGIKLEMVHVKSIQQVAYHEDFKSYFHGLVIEPNAAQRELGDEINAAAFGYGLPDDVLIHAGCNPPRVHETALSAVGAAVVGGSTVEVRTSIDAAACERATESVERSAAGGGGARYSTLPH